MTTVRPKGSSPAASRHRSVRRGSRGPRSGEVLLAAIFLLGAGHSMAEEALGRLFFSPAERNRLDTARETAIANANRPRQQVVASSPAIAPSRVLTLNGIVRRSDGESTVWVNGAPIDSGSTAADLSIRNVGTNLAGIRITDVGRTIRLKVGQSAEAITGVVEESFERKHTLPAAAPLRSPGDPPSSPGEIGDATSDATDPLAGENRVRRRGTRHGDEDR